MVIPDYTAVSVSDADAVIIIQEEDSSSSSDDFLSELSNVVNCSETCSVCYRHISRPRQWYSCEMREFKFYFCGLSCMKDFAAEWRKKVKHQW